MATDTELRPGTWVRVIGNDENRGKAGRVVGPRILGNSCDSPRGYDVVWGLDGTLAFYTPDHLEVIAE